MRTHITRKGMGFAILISMVLGVVFLFIWFGLYNLYVSVAGVSMTPNAIHDRNEKCLAMTKSYMRDDQMLEDTDFDGLADVCDMCPNNYLSDAEDDFDTDPDKDGLSSENNAEMASPYNAGEYTIQGCDLNPRSDVNPKCALGLDEISKQCKCPNGFEKDHCA